MLLPTARRSGRATAAAALVASFLATGTSVAQQPASGSGPQDPRIVSDDRREGEDDRIRRRLEWFYGSRRAGTTSDAEMSRLRKAAVEATREALKVQRGRRADGAEVGGFGPDSWVSKGPSPSTFGGWDFGNIAGRTAAIAADWAGGILYLGTASGGVWKSANDGLTWTSIFDSAGSMAIGTVAVDPGDPDVIWVGTGENVSGCESYFGIGLLRSPDAGQTWELRNGSGAATLDDLSSFADVAIDPRDPDRLVVGGRIRGCVDGASAPGGIFTTADGGLTWTERLAGSEVYEIARDPAVPDTLWAATSSGVYKSADNGVGWTLQTASGLPNGNVGRTEIAIAPSNGNVVYALFDFGSNSFWRTTNGGASWTQMSSGSDACDGQCWYNMVLRVDPTDPSVVYRGTIRLFKTVNGGASWSALTSTWGPGQDVHQDTHVLLVHPTLPDTFYVGSDGGLWKSQDGGASFTNRNGNLNITQFYAVGTRATDPESVICGGAQDNSSLARTTSNVWDLQFASGDGFVCQIDPQDPDYAYVTSYPNGGFPSVYRSTTGLFGGYSEITFGNGIVNGESSNWVTPYLLDPNSPNVLYLGTQRMYRSTNHGSSWTPQGSGDFTSGGSNSLVSIDLNPNFPNHLYTGSTDGRVWRSENSGTNWTNISAGLPSRSINDVASDPADPDRAFAVVGGFNTAHLWEWTQAGGWIARGGGLPNVPANSVLMLGSSDLLVGNDVGVFRSTDGGLSFAPYVEGFPLGTVVTDLKLDLPDVVTAGTYGRGAWQVHVDPAAALVGYDSIVLPLAQEDGDGDDKVEPGETWSVEPVLRNLGGLTALGVTARLAAATPGVTVLEPAIGQFGDLAGGESAPPLAPFRFTVDPTFPCGDSAFFDLVEIHSTNEPGSYPDALAAFSVKVLNHIFQPGGGGGGGGSAAAPLVLGTASLRTSSPRLVAGRVWLHAAGTDSGGGTGVEIPHRAIAVRAVAADRIGGQPERHEDGRTAGAIAGKLVIDARPDGRDEYLALEPGAFAGSFDLTRYRGQRAWLGYVQEAGPAGPAVDRLEFVTLAPGEPICHVTPWPGSVPDSFFRRVGADVEASWADSCNLGELSQTYSVQAGDLDLLQSTGVYTHAALGGLCDRLSPALFAPGAGNEYYLVVPNAAGREGGHGSTSSGEPRPHLDESCGEPREASCP